ncbi:basic proline-rich protein-like isoform X2 [Heterocephalus glaber]|uniref:Basic proline-rich protein-like isoform X2 n=1 Tax=Heterocephalus glaber TaxID=10181 RepID=A0AAX6TLW0_HETGA|nr:basic proline-rich protein-like isoform X2 [Heterocephalus glaber]
MAKSPCFRPLTRSCLAIRGSTGRVSPDPETWGPEMSGSPGQISRDLDARHSGPPSPGQVQSGPATAIGAQWEESRAEDCMVRMALAGMQHPPQGSPQNGTSWTATPSTWTPSWTPLGPAFPPCRRGWWEGPAPAPAEVPHVEPEPAPPAASCPALGPQPESVAAPSPAAVLGHPVVAQRSVSPPELRLGPAPGPSHCFLHLCCLLFWYLQLPLFLGFI